jgi:hypothetical protein
MNQFHETNIDDKSEQRGNKSEIWGTGGDKLGQRGKKYRPMGDRAGQQIRIELITADTK